MLMPLCVCVCVSVMSRRTQVGLGNLLWNNRWFFNDFFSTYVVHTIGPIGRSCFLLPIDTLKEYKKRKYPTLHVTSEELDELNMSSSFRFSSK